MGENEDVNFYLTKLEATACPWPKKEEVSRLVPCLTGKALKACKSPSPQESADYKLIQAKIQQQAELHSMANWQQFRTYQFKEEEGPRKALNQLKEFARGWLSFEIRTSQEVFENVVLEQFVNILPEAVQHWVLEHQPNNCDQALELAENYLLAHQTSVSRYSETRKRDNGFPKEEVPLEKIAGYWLKRSQKTNPALITQAQSQMRWLRERLPDPQGALSETPGKTKKPNTQKKKKKKEENLC
uniref:SCAN box domain-containing protein n=1 Tax=Pseudonaja textilis TaxID=8673 RepID=A0A670XWR6_PSETE